MPRARVFYQSDHSRIAVTSLIPWLMKPMELGLLMDQAMMDPLDAVRCRWLGHGIGKGVTHLTKNISVFAAPSSLTCGLHGALVQGFEDIPVDPVPFCYEETALIGFNGFIRWVYFARPERPSYFGVDFCLDFEEKRGVANSMRSMSRIVRKVAIHGIPLDTEVVFLTPTMCEEPDLTRWKREAGLLTVRDWITLGRKRFEKNSIHCSRCGQATFTNTEMRFCYRCGVARPNSSNLTQTGER